MTDDVRPTIRSACETLFDGFDYITENMLQSSFQRIAEMTGERFNNRLRAEVRAEVEASGKYKKGE